MRKSVDDFRAYARSEAAHNFRNAEVGRCRALRLGSHVWVTGSAAERADGRVYRKGDARAQAARCLDVIEQALKSVDAAMGDVVRTSVFITDPCSWKAVEHVLWSRFPDRPPVKVVEVEMLPRPEMLVEIEAEAFIARG